MRIIKFGVWHKKWKVMSPPIEIWNMDDVVYELEAIAKQKKGVPIDSTSRDDLVYMQYTGLKDKNGKEIYEGDIVRFGKISMGVIKYRNGKYWIRCLKTGIWFTLYNYYDPINDNVDVEVIGNVFENMDKCCICGKEVGTTKDGIVCFW